MIGSWGEWMTEMNANAEIDRARRSSRSRLAEKDAAIDLWEEHSNELRKHLDTMTNIAQTYKDNYEAEKNTRETLEMENRRLKEELKTIERTNAINYAEKKAYMSYSRSVRLASDLMPAFEPVLYNGDQGIWIRERLRSVAGKVYDVGGSIDDGARAATRELWSHVQKPPLERSVERAAQIDGEVSEVIKNRFGVEVDPGRLTPEDWALHAKCGEFRVA